MNDVVLFLFFIVAILTFIFGSSFVWVFVVVSWFAYQDESYPQYLKVCFWFATGYSAYPWIHPLLEKLCTKINRQFDR